MGFSRQEYWSGVPLPSPRSLFSQSQFPTLWVNNLIANWSIDYMELPALFWGFSILSQFSEHFPPSFNTVQIYVTSVLFFFSSCFIALTRIINRFWKEVMRVVIFTLLLTVITKQLFWAAAYAFYSMIILLTPRVKIKIPTTSSHFAFPGAPFKITTYCWALGILVTSTPITL